MLENLECAADVALLESASTNRDLEREPATKCRI
jgi:hypothetical protein